MRSGAVVSHWHYVCELSAWWSYVHSSSLPWICRCYEGMSTAVSLQLTQLTRTQINQYIINTTFTHFIFTMPCVPLPEHIMVSSIFDSLVPVAIDYGYCVMKRAWSVTRWVCVSWTRGSPHSSRVPDAHPWFKREALRAHGYRLPWGLLMLITSQAPGIHKKKLLSKCFEIFPALVHFDKYWLPRGKVFQVSSGPRKCEEKNVFVISIVPADDLAPFGARSSAGTVMTKLYL